MPTASGRIAPANLVFINDAPTQDEVELLSPALSDEVGRQLGCTSVRDELTSRSEAPGGFSAADEQFGQTEELRDRIRGLLHDYNSDRDVMTEHWQNTDDVGAHSILFALDLASYDVAGLTDARAGPLQGPALLLASSRALSSEDVKRRQRVGKSGKQNEFGTTGRFGVGLNCNYHVSDAFTLLANDALHVFDPMQSVVARGADTGKQYTLSSLRESFPAMLAPFKWLDVKEWPAIFRLPLRTIASDFGARVTASSVEQLIADFADTAAQLLLFSKHVRRAKCIVRDADVKRKLSTTLEICGTGAADPALALMASLPARLEDLKDRRAVSRLKVKKQMAGSAASTSEWIVSHVLSADDSTMAHLEAMRSSGEAALLPHGAAAFRVSPPERGRVDCGQVCCYFPVANLECGPPLLLQGHSDLPSSRKMVALPSSTKGSSAPAALWNEQLLSGPIASSFVALLKVVRDGVRKRFQQLEKYLQLFALPDGPHNGATIQLRNTLRSAAVKMAVEERLPLFPVVADGRLLGFHPSESVLFRLGGAALSDRVQDVLVHSGMKLICLPQPLEAALRTAGSAHAQCLNAHALCNHLANIPPLRDAQPTDIDAMLKFVTRQLLEAAQPPRSDMFSMLRGVPLLRLKTGELRAFNEKEPVYFETALLATSLNEIIAYEQLQVLLPPDFATSRLALEEAVDFIGVKTMSLSSLRARESFIEENMLSEDKSEEDSTRRWLLAFWQLAWSELTAGLLSPSQFLSGFSHWRLLLALGADGKTLLPLERAGEAFSLKDVDPVRKQGIADAIFRAGFFILLQLFGHAGDDAKRAEVLQKYGAPMPQVGTEGLLHLLMRSPDRLASLSAKDRSNLLDYFGSRPAAELSVPTRKVIQSLPLFLLARKAEGDAASFTSLCSFKSAVCLMQDGGCKQDHVGNLIDLPIPGVVHLAWPSSMSSSIYRSLGIQLLSASDFVAKDVCDALEHAAQMGEAQLDPFLTELLGWLDPNVDGRGSWVPAILDRAQAAPFVRTMSGNMILPNQSLHPGLKLAKLFPAELMPWMPCEALHKHARLLSLLGALRSLPPIAIAKCAAALGADAGEVDDSSRERSRRLLPELIDAVKAQKNAFPASISADLEAAAACRIVFARRVRGEQDVAQHVQALLNAITRLEPDLPVPVRPKMPGTLHLARLDSNLALAEAWEALVWALPDCSVLARDEYDNLDFDRQMDVSISQRAEQLKTIVAALHATQAQYHDADNLLLGHRGLGVRRDCECILHAIEARIAAGRDADISAKVMGELSEVQSSRCASSATQAASWTPLVCCWLRHREFSNASLTAHQSIRASCKKTKYFHHIWPRLANLTGVRSEPELNDWVRCLAHVASQATDNNGRPLPTEKRAAEYAHPIIFKAIASVESNGSGPQQDLFLFDDAGRLRPAAELVWIDRPRWKDRCSALCEEQGLGFFRDRRPSMGEKLCKRTAMRPLSEVVREVVQPQMLAACVEPNENERKLLHLLASTEFAEGLRACVAGSSSAKEHALFSELDC